MTSFQENERPTPGIRLLMGLFAAGMIAVFAVACWLQPDPRGFGTHLQLGSQISQFSVFKAATDVVGAKRLNSRVAGCMVSESIDFVTAVCLMRLVVLNRGLPNADTRNSSATMSLRRRR